MSPLSAGLFRYAIAESGTAAIDALFTDSPLSVAQVKNFLLAAPYFSNTNHKNHTIMQFKWDIIVIRIHNVINTKSTAYEICYMYVYKYL